MLDPIEPAYNQSRPDGWLRLAASTFNQLWISMPPVLVSVPNVTQNSLHPLSTSSITARPSSGFYGGGKDNRGRCTDNLSGCHPIWAIGAPISFIPHFYADCLFCPAATLPVYPAWDRHQILLAGIVSGLGVMASKYLTARSTDLSAFSGDGSGFGNICGSDF